jgi:hypothetical protein
MDRLSEQQVSVSSRSSVAVAFTEAPVLDKH